MLIKLIQKIFSTKIYIQIWENRLKLHDIDNDVVFDEKPFLAVDINNSKRHKTIAIGNSAYSTPENDKTYVLNPFSHPRLLCGDFMHAEELLRKAIQKISKSKLIPPAPAIVIHPMERLEGGITDVEMRVFRELALGAGAREVVLHVGEELSHETFDYEKVKQELWKKSS